MDRATFMETLRRYPRVRDSDFVLPPRSRAPVRRSFVSTLVQLARCIAFTWGN